MEVQVAIGADHGGLSLKEDLVSWLTTQGFRLRDLGATVYDPNDDYPGFAVAVARAVAENSCQRGIILCGSGIGACITANKVPGVRASVAHDLYSAIQGVEHDDMNVLCLGARVIGTETARELAMAFLRASFSGEERHRRRLDELLRIEALYAGSEPPASSDNRR